MNLVDKGDLLLELERLKNMPYPCKVYEQIVGFCDALEKMQRFLGTLQSKQIDFAYLQSWYQASIDKTEEPIWTDKHLEELYNDFYLIPKR